MKYFALALCLSASLTSSFAQDFFPLHVGNQWIYKTAIGRTATFTSIDIPRTETIGDRTYWVVRGFEGGTLALLRSEDGTLYHYNNETRREEVWAVFPTKEGDTYETAINTCNKQAIVESRSAKATLPAGEFWNALRVRYPAANCADAGLSTDTFAPYIGLVERSFITIAGPRKMELVYARVGGVTVLSQPALSFAVTLDQLAYDVGASAAVRMTIRNTAANTLTLNFSSGQRYDLVIRDQAGKEVFRDSARKTYVQVTGTEEIAQGERNYVELVTLASLDGQALPAGRYTMEAWLTTSWAGQRPQYAGTVGFEIREALAR